MKLLIVGTQGTKASDLPRVLGDHTFAIGDLFEKHEVVTTDVTDRVREWVSYAARNRIERVLFLVNPRRVQKTRYALRLQFAEWYPQLNGVEVAFLRHPRQRNGNDETSQKFWRETGEWTQS